MRPAPTSEKARALSRGRPTWAKYRVKSPSRRPQPLKETGTACSSVHSGTIRKAAPAGSGMPRPRAIAR